MDGVKCSLDPVRVFFFNVRLPRAVAEVGLYIFSAVVQCLPNILQSRRLPLAKSYNDIPVKFYRLAVSLKNLKQIFNLTAV